MSKLLFSCEHASCELPEEFKKNLGISEKILNSHEGYDIGAQEVCKHFVDTIGTSGFYGEFSRLLVDLNRSYESRNLFSQYSRKLSYKEKDKIIDLYYDPYRKKIENFVNDLIKNGQTVIHFSIHSFTPVLKGQTRFTDIGLLYDPAREKEKEAAYEIKSEMEKISPLQIKMNYPYLGISDGLTTNFRKIHKSTEYLGLEIEINQKCLLDKKSRLEVCDPLTLAIKHVNKLGLI